MLRWLYNDYFNMVLTFFARSASLALKKVGKSWINSTTVKICCNPSPQKNGIEARLHSGDALYVKIVIEDRETHHYPMS